MEREPLPLQEKLVTAVSIDYPAAADVLVSFPQKWELVQQLERPDHRLYVAGLPPRQEAPRRDHFHGLPPHVNLALTTYRHYKMFEPWPMPGFYISWDEETASGRIEKPKDLKIQLQSLGQAQAWYGAELAVIWECFFHETRRRDSNWEAELAEFWRAVEEDVGAAQIFTEPHEPTFEAGYADFLSRLGYAPHPHHPRWWHKTRD